MHLTHGRKGLAKFTTAGLIAVAAALQVYAHWGGLLQTGDSCHYIAAAKSFKQSFTLGADYKYFPPLFPLVLSVFGSYWIWIHVLLSIAVSLLIIEQTSVIKNGVIRFVCQASIISGVHLLMIGVFLWSELLFLLLLLLFVRSLEKNFVAAVILGFFLCLQRNAGIFFIAGAALWYWDLRKSIILFVIGSSGVVAWNVYAGIAGEYDYFASFFHNTSVIATELMRVIAPVPAVILPVVIGFLIYFLRKDLLLVLMACYVAGLVVIFRFEAYDADRYIAVIVPFFLISAFRAFEIVVEKQTSGVQKMLMIVVVCWLLYPFSRTVKNAVQWHNVSFTSYFCAIQF